MSRRAPTDAARAILAKYLEIARLRALAVSEDPGNPRAAMRALAAMFPSALRELDQLPMAAITARVSELERAVRGESPPPAWVEIQFDVHAWLRFALRVKSAAGARRDRVRGLEVARQSPDAAALGVEESDVDAILSPPVGRLLPWVHARVAAANGTTCDVVAAAFDARP